MNTLSPNDISAADVRAMVIRDAEILAAEFQAAPEYKDCGNWLPAIQYGNMPVAVTVDERGSLTRLDRRCHLSGAIAYWTSVNHYDNVTEILK